MFTPTEGTKVKVIKPWEPAVSHLEVYYKSDKESRLQKVTAFDPERERFKAYSLADLHYIPTNSLPAILTDGVFSHL